MTMQQLADDVRVIAAQAERRRIIGEILKHVGLHRLAGRHAIANALDALATVVEYPEER